MAQQEKATFGDALRDALLNARQNQAWLAKQLDIDPGQVSRWTNNKARPHVATVARIEKLLDTNLRDAFRDTLPEFDLFVSAPINGLGAERIEAHRVEVGRVVEAANDVANGVYWSGQEVGSLKDLGAADLSTETNLKVFAECQAYLYLQFGEMINPSGALVELGFALGQKLRTTMIIKKDLPTPYMFRGIGTVAGKLEFLPEVHKYEVDDIDDAVRLIQHNGPQLFGLN
jgi:transcriptional regulator with XRE-family HTH domain